MVARGATPSPENAAVYAATASSFLGAVGVSLLSFFEHRRSIRPSDTIVLYLLTSLLVDSLHLWFTLADIASTRHDHRVIIQSLLLCLISKGILLITEASGKDKLLLKAARSYAPEETAGILQRTFFWWINPILKRGGSGTLKDDDFQVIDAELSARKLRQSINRLWDSRGSLLS